MNCRATPEPPTLSIAAVELDIGISKDTLRAWERRYGFPQPARDAHGERAYPLEQVERLRTVKRLLDAGHRPGQVLPMDADALGQLADSTPTAPARRAAAAPETAALDERLTLIRSGDMDTLCQQLSREAHRLGLARFVDEVVSPLNTAVGDGWMQGRLAVFHEHLYTEAVHRVLRQLRSTLAPAAVQARPRVLLATVPGEPHSIGLLMVEALLALEGARCWSLGVQSPVSDIAQAAGTLDADIVALSFTGCTTANQVTSNLQELRAALPARQAIWVGGSAPVLYRRRIDGVRAMKQLDELQDAVAEWRAQNRN